MGGAALRRMLGLPDGPPEAVTGVTLDSRRVRPGDLYAALPGFTTHGARFAGMAQGSGAVAILTDPAGAALIRSEPGVELPRPGRRRPPGSARCSVGPGVRRPRRGPCDHGDHRHQRQDDRELPARCRPAGCGTHHRGDRHGRHPHRRRGPPGRPDHAGGPGPARPAGGDARARRVGGHDGGVQSRAGAGPGRRHGLRSRRVHQPEPGPPGLPRRHGVLLRRQGPAVHRPPRHRGPGLRRRPVGPAAGRRGGHSGRDVRGGGSGGLDGHARDPR